MSSEAESPYTKGDRFNKDINLRHIKNANRWQFVAILMTLAACGMSYGMYKLASEKKIIPYMVQVDKFGNTMTVGVIGEVTKKNQDNIVDAELIKWLFDVKETTVDAGVMNKKIMEAYDNILPESAAKTKLDQYYQSRDPFERAKSESVEITIERMIPLSKFSYQIEWTEKISSRESNELLDTQSWQILITYRQLIPTTREVVLKNPAGIFIEDFTWGKNLKRKSEQ